MQCRPRGRGQPCCEAWCESVCVFVVPGLQSGDARRLGRDSCTLGCELGYCREGTNEVRMNRCAEASRDWKTTVLACVPGGTSRQALSHLTGNCLPLSAPAVPIGCSLNMLFMNSVLMKQKFESSPAARFKLPSGSRLRLSAIVQSGYSLHWTPCEGTHSSFSLYM